MNSQRLAAHETLELHELLASTTTSYTICNVLLPHVTDQELGGILMNQAQSCHKHITDLQHALTRSAFN
ncbi:MAG: hypothetical protein OWR52_03945 [Acidibacillus sp.]|uniref:Spore coat protein n=1 Tax=Sulfoacidibacillus ferrooxidans TaxID=2005001 RepID=A0A9X2AD47_9BACL|nr:hypothetical protein [Sulfoacidibacillus ferrooxidans]MCI0183010.1 hypothetical protein [Sulfoacidibacillus ferrooxidans]MCY0892646.1 hypothetical protein [Acidibacillus sp.]